MILGNTKKKLNVTLKESNLNNPRCQPGVTTTRNSSSEGAEYKTGYCLSYCDILRPFRA